MATETKEKDSLILWDNISFKLRLSISEATMETKRMEAEIWAGWLINALTASMS